MSVKILVLEDSMILLKLISSILKAKGYEIIECQSVAEAKAVNEHISMAILDYQLPDGNGLDVAMHLKIKNSSLPMMLLTARGSRVSRQEAVAAGIREYCEKPLSGDVLSAKVAALIGKSV